MADLEDALAHIATGGVADEVEGERLDFKRPADSRNDTVSGLAEAAACFANAGGGSIVLGVADGIRGRAAIVGTDLAGPWVRKRIYEKTSPALDVRVREIYFDGVRLLVVDVQEGLGVYQTDGRGPRRRYEKSCLPMSTTEVARLHDERSGLDWSAQLSGRSVEMIDEQALALLRSLVRTSGATQPRLSNLTDLDLLSALSLVTDGSELTNAGALLLCAARRGHGHEVLAYQYRGTAGGEVRQGRRWSAPALVAFSEVMTTLEARIGSTPLNLPSGQQVQIQDYPLAAVREAVANAMTHGEHREHRPVLVEHSPELLEVRSPGPLVTGISPANILTHPPKARFPLLAEVMRSCGLGEKWGQGFDRMYREMIRDGRNAPSVSVTGTDEPETIVQFLGGPPNARIAKFVSTLPAAEQDDTDALLVIATLVTRRTVNAEQLSPIVQRDVTASQAVLHRLSRGPAQLIEPTPRSAARRQPDFRLRGQVLAALGPALGYRTRSRTDSDRKIVAHLREYGAINNAAVQRMLDIDVYAARDVLREMVDRQVLVRTSEQARGTAVRYGPGVKFPRRK